MIASSFAGIWLPMRGFARVSLAAVLKAD